MQKTFFSPHKHARLQHEYDNVILLMLRVSKKRWRHNFTNISTNYEIKVWRWSFLAQNQKPKSDVQAIKNTSFVTNIWVSWQVILEFVWPFESFFTAKELQKLQIEHKIKYRMRELGIKGTYYIHSKYSKVPEKYFYNISYW